LQKLLPEGVVLVNFLEYGRSQKARLVAFVVTKEYVRRVDLGEAAPIATAVDEFRATLQRRTQPILRKDDPAVMLRDKVWLPLVPHLGDAKLVLLSPDGALNRLPFAALPSKADDKFVLEDVALAVLPVPRMLVELLAPRPQRPDSPPSLLALGDVDFDAAEAVQRQPASESASWKRRLAGGPKNWSRLPGTRGELLSIEDTFRKAVAKGKLTTLREGQATVAAVRQLAPQHEYLHLATHGFFAPKEVKSALQGGPAPEGLRAGNEMPRFVGHHPGLLLGLVLAGANKPTEADDGVLTALEVGELDLSKVELAVLLACETGLGEVAGGEGVLGLQRTFQVAGARTTVTSLWKVSDDATRQLMERFYENYWKQGMGTLEALRDAQLWLLKEGVKRGVVREEDTKNPRTPPYYWAAFVLSGDWR
jgi:CHAT domain-containing protein